MLVHFNKTGLPIFKENKRKRGISMKIKDIYELIKTNNCIKDVVLADGDSWVMFVREAVEAMYMQYSAIDIKSMEYKFNRLIIHI